MLYYIYSNGKAYKIIVAGLTDIKNGTPYLTFGLVILFRLNCSVVELYILKLTF